MTYLLDTNVVSELMAKTPHPEVERRFEAASAEIAISSVTWHELLFGVAKLPNSRRKYSLESFLKEVVVPSIPVLPYDAEAAAWHAHERARLSGKGLTPPFADGQIAAVAFVRDLTLVTRNLADFREFAHLRTETWHSESV